MINPLLANLFLHHAFDNWMRANQPYITLERYADDIICHCRSEAQARWLLDQIKGRRRARCGLELNGEKARVFYCKDGRRRKDYPNCSFDFLGFTFRARKARNRKGGYFTGFLPAVSNEVAKEIRRVIRRWRRHRCTDKSLEDLAEGINQVGSFVLQKRCIYSSWGIDVQLLSSYTHSICNSLGLCVMHDFEHVVKKLNAASCKAEGCADTIVPRVGMVHIWPLYRAYYVA
ncbi:MAG: reverse transcriptase domain-containing protein [Actinomycetota bacterium]|nr:reverse transcriptase domain-containing protein [Actinomycetota bacterium]